MKGDSVAVGRGGLGDGREAAELCGCVERSAPWGEPAARGDRRGDRLGAARGIVGAAAPRADRSPALRAAGDAEGASAAAALRVVRPAARGGALRSAVVPALLRLCGRRGRARRDDAVPLPPGCGRERRARSLPRRGQPAACRQGPDPQDRHADRRHDHRRRAASPSAPQALGRKFLPSPTPAGRRRTAAPISAIASMPASTRARA